MDGGLVDEEAAGLLDGAGLGFTNGQKFGSSIAFSATHL